MKDSCLELDFNVTHRVVAHARYADGDHIRLEKIGSIAILNKYRLTNSSGKEMREIENAHVIRLMYKSTSSNRDSDDLSIGFHRSTVARERKLTNNKTTKKNYLVRTYLKDIFSFAEHQDNCTYSLGYESTLQRNSNNRVLSHRPGAKNAENLALAGRIIIDDKSLYVPHYTPNISTQKLMLRHIISKAATDMSFIKRSSHMKDVTTENNWTFELRDGIVLMYQFI